MKYFVRMLMNVCCKDCHVLRTVLSVNLVKWFWVSVGDVQKPRDVNKCHQHHMCKHDHMHQSQDNFCRG